MAKLPNSGISIHLVAQTLGYPVRYNVGGLCTHPNINMWSKHKPVNLPDVEPDRSTDWWRGKNKDCGLQIVRTSGDVAEYGYTSREAPFRIFDFMGYDTSTISGMRFKGTTFEFDLIRQKNEDLVIEADDTPDRITIYDMREAPFLQGKDFVVRISSTTPVGSNSKSYVIPLTSPQIAVSVPYTDLVDLGAGKYDISALAKDKVTPFGEIGIFVVRNVELYITNDIGVHLIGGDNDWFRVYDPVLAETHDWDYYHLGTSRILDLSGNSGFWIQFGVLENLSDFTVETNNMFLTFEWGIYKHRCNIYVMSNHTDSGTSFSRAPGITGGAYWGVPSINLPQLQSSGGSFVPCIVYYEVQAPDGTYYKISDSYGMRIKNSNGVPPNVG